MGRAFAIVVFGLLSSSVALEAAEALGDAIGNRSLGSWLNSAYALLKLAVILAFTIFVIVRAPARRRARRPLAFAACAAAIGAVVSLERPDPSTASGLVIGGEALALVSCGWVLLSAIALGRCFGVLPEARGLVTNGPYGLVRHPIYLGEFGACAGLVIASPSARNLIAALVFGLAQSARMGMEERALAREFPHYAAYAARTPRVLPRPRSGRRARLRGVPFGQGEAA